VGRAAGIGNEELAALRAPSPATLGSERETAALAYADAIVAGHEVGAEVFAAVRRQFSEEEIIELTATITWEICAAKFNRALEIEWR
jgi:alkylhydroperoxidase family enzyme